MFRSVKRIVTFSQRRYHVAKAQTRRTDLECFLDSADDSRRVTLAPSQEKAVELSRTHNVIVKGGPGSGKTATALGIIAASHCPKTLMLTFSSRLQTVAAECLRRPSTVITYHALLGRLFRSRPGLQDNRRLEKLMRDGQPDYPEFGGFWAYDTVILDEFHNCTPQIYFLVVVALLVIQKVANAIPKLVVLGDKNQALEGPSGADARFFTMARDMFRFTCEGSEAAAGAHDFVEQTLCDGGFRCAPEMARFVENVYGYGSKKLRVPARTVPGEKPTFLYADLKSKTQLKHLVRLIDEYGPGNTAILAPTVMDNPTVARLASILSRNFNLPVAHPLGDERALDYALTREKICVATIEQYKGEEHDVVVVCGVDPTKWENNTMPPSVYVALTRARNHLVVLHHSMTMPPLPKPMWSPLMLYSDIKRRPQRPAPELEKRALGNTTKKRAVAVGSIIKLIPEHDLTNLVDDHLEIAIPDLIPDGLGAVAKKAILNPDDGSLEWIGNLDKFVLVAAYEYHIQGTLRTLGLDPDGHRHHQPRIASFPEQWDAKQAAWICRHACLSDAMRTGWYARHHAIKKIPDSRLGWSLEYDVLSRAVRRLSRRFGRPGHNGLGFGVRVAGEHMFDGAASVVEGYIDIVELNETARQPQSDAMQGFSPDAPRNHTGQGSTAHRIIEVKLVEELTADHAVEAIIKSYLWAHGHPGEPVPPAVVFNARDGEEMHVKPRYGVASVERLIESLTKAHRDALNRPSLTHDEFAQMCCRIQARAKEVSRLMKPIDSSTLVCIPPQTATSPRKKPTRPQQPPTIKWEDLAWKSPAKRAA